jgi:hypothetical protein
MVGFSEFLVLGEIPFRIRAAQTADPASQALWRDADTSRGPGQAHLSPESDFAEEPHFGEVAPRPLPNTEL